MDKINKYQKILEEVLREQSEGKSENMPLVKSKLIIDKKEQHFILMDMGWSQLGFIHNWVFHIEIKDQKVHLHKNMTDFDIVGTLIENGIAKEDIIITVLEEPSNLSESQLGEAA